MHDVGTDTRIGVKRAVPGDQLTLRGAYDHSVQNPHVANALVEQGLTAPRDGALGEETLDEMCRGVFGVARKVSELLK
jgi:hypothetical protein